MLERVGLRVYAGLHAVLLPRLRTVAVGIRAVAIRGEYRVRSCGNPAFVARSDTIYRSMKRTVLTVEPQATSGDTLSVGPDQIDLQHTVCGALGKFPFGASDQSRHRQQ